MSELPTSKSRTSKVSWLTTRDPRSYLEWEDINMDFVVGFPPTQRQYDSIFVVVDRLTKSAHFIPVKSSYSTKDYARIFIDEIVC